jgi:hypothetical protein
MAPQLRDPRIGLERMRRIHDHENSYGHRGANALAPA